MPSIPGMTISDITMSGGVDRLYSRAWIPFCANPIISQPIFSHEKAFEILYGKNYGFTITSQLSFGTRVELRIPYKTSIASKENTND